MTAHDTMYGTVCFMDLLKTLSKPAAWGSGWTSAFVCFSAATGYWLAGERERALCWAALGVVAQSGYNAAVKRSRSRHHPALRCLYLKTRQFPYRIVMLCAAGKTTYSRKPKIAFSGKRWGRRSRTQDNRDYFLAGFAPGAQIPLTGLYLTVRGDANYT